MANYFGTAPADRLLRYQVVAQGLLQDRTSFEAHWRELGDYLLPRRPRFWSGDRNKGDKRNQFILDSTGRFAVRTLQSGLHAGLTSPARPWMKLTTPDPDLAKSPAVKQWLSVVTARMLVVFQQTNLYNCLPIVYGDMGVFGTACMGVVDDTKDLFRCYPYPIGTYALGLDPRGLASACVRRYQLSVRQVVQTFGVGADGRTIDWTKLSTRVKTCWEKALYEEPIDLTWLVLPNPDANPRRLEAKFKPFASCHWEDGGAEGQFLRESGFSVFPILAPRWEITGEDTYGTDCPGMTALPDVKQLQAQQRAKAKAIQKMIDPPVQAPTSLRTQKTSLLPGDITYVDVPSGMQGMRTVHDVRIDLNHFVADIGQTQARIQRAFFEDLFLMLAQSDGDRGSQPITAREVAERHEEKLLALGPVLERTNDELLEPLIDRVYQMMDAAGAIPPAPEELQGVTIKAEYTSIMAQAQKLVAVVGLDRFMTSAAAMTQIFPAVRHKININRVVDLYSEALGIDPGVVRSDEDADALAAQEAEAAQREQEAKQAQQMAAAMKSAGTTPMTGDTALNRLVGQATAGGGVAPEVAA
jgi:hypothetical protein